MTGGGLVLNAQPTRSFAGDPNVSNPGRKTVSGSPGFKNQLHKAVHREEKLEAQPINTPLKTDSKNKLTPESTGLENQQPIEPEIAEPAQVEAILQWLQEAVKALESMGISPAVLDQLIPGIANLGTSQENLPSSTDLLAIEEKFIRLLNHSSNQNQTIFNGQELPVKLTAEQKEVLHKILSQVPIKTRDHPQTQMVRSDKTSGEADLRFGLKAVRADLPIKNDYTDVKKIIELENHRYEGSKTEIRPAEKQEPSLSKGQDDSAKVIPFVSRGEEAVLKSDSRSWPTVLASKNGVNARELVDQIVKKAELLVKQNFSQMKIDLKPEFLGKMTIKVMVEEGVVTARFITDNHGVKQLLESNLNTLKQSLEAQGIKVEKTEVDVQLNNGDSSDWSRDSYYQWEAQHHNSESGANEPLALELAYDGATSELVADDLPGYGFSPDGSMNFLI